MNDVPHEGADVSSCSKYVFPVLILTDFASQLRSASLHPTVPRFYLFNSWLDGRIFFSYIRLLRRKGSKDYVWPLHLLDWKGRKRKKKNEKSSLNRMPADNYQTGVRQGAFSALERWHSNLAPNSCNKAGRTSATAVSHS